MKKYFLHNGQNQLGPFSIEELKSQNIKEDTSIWFDGLAEWTLAGQIEDLKHLFASAPPPLKSATPPLISKPQHIDTNFQETTKSISKLKMYWIIGGAVLIGLIIFLVVQNKSRQQEKEALSTQLSITQQQLHAKTEEQNKQEQEKQKSIASATVRNMEYRNNWYKYISADILSFKALSLGGFENISLKATNNTEFPIDLIIAEVTYWKDNGDIFKTEKISITDIAAKDVSYATAPASPRGTKLTIDIVKITSRSFNFCFDRNAMPGTDGIFYDNRNPKDPWKCGQ